MNEWTIDLLDTWVHERMNEWMDEWKCNMKNKGMKTIQETWKIETWQQERKHERMKTWRHEKMKAWKGEKNEWLKNKWMKQINEKPAGLKSLNRHE